MIRLFFLVILAKIERMFYDWVVRGVKECDTRKLVSLARESLPVL